MAQAAAEGSGKAADGPGLATATQPKCDGPLQCLLRLGPGELGMLNFPCPLPCALFCTLNHETLQLVVSLMLAGWQGDPVQPEEAAATAPPTSDPLPLPGPLPLPVPGLGDPLPQAPSSDPLPQAPSTRWQRAAPHGQAQATGGPGAVLLWARPPGPCPVGTASPALHDGRAIGTWRGQSQGDDDVSERQAAVALATFADELDTVVQAGEGFEIDLTSEHRFPWRRYLQGLPLRMAVARFSVAALLGITDPNRAGRPRVDFLAWEVGGQRVARIPSSAEILYGRVDEWGAWALPPGRRGGGQGLALMVLRDAHDYNMRFDKLGTAELHALMAGLDSGPGAALPWARWGHRVLDLSDGSLVQWWRWVANGGRGTAECIGAGIQGFYWDLDTMHAVIHQTDGKWVHVGLDRRQVRGP